MILRLHRSLKGLVLLFCVLGFGSCDSQKKTSEKAISENMKAAHIRDLQSKDKECHFLIELDESGELLNPLKLDSTYHQDGLAIYIEFEYSRLMELLGGVL